MLFVPPFTASPYCSTLHWPLSERDAVGIPMFSNTQLFCHCLPILFFFNKIWINEVFYKGFTGPPLFRIGIATLNYSVLTASYPLPATYQYLCLQPSVWIQTTTHPRGHLQSWLPQASNVDFLLCKANCISRLVVKSTKFNIECPNGKTIFSFMGLWAPRIAGSAG